MPKVSQSKINVSHLWHFQHRDDKLRIASLIAKSILLLLYIDWFLWRRESSPQELGLLLAIPFTIEVGLQIAIFFNKSTPPLGEEAKPIAQTTKATLSPSLNHASNPIQPEQFAAEIGKSMGGKDWGDTLTQIGIWSALLFILCASNLPVIAMYLYGSSHPDYGKKYLESATQYTVSDLPGFTLITTAGLGLIFNDAHLAIRTKFPSLAEKSKLFSHLFFWIYFLLLILLSCIRLPTQQS
jgi:hypothetical protein